MHNEQRKLSIINITNYLNKQSRNSSLRKFKIITLIKQLCHRIRNNYRLKKDQKGLTKYLDSYKPDYIVVSQYQVLDLIEDKYLPITFMHQHGSFIDTFPVIVSSIVIFSFSQIYFKRLTISSLEILLK